MNFRTHTPSPTTETCAVCNLHRRDWAVYHDGCPVVVVPYEAPPPGVPIIERATTRTDAATLENNANRIAELEGAIYEMVEAYYRAVKSERTQVMAPAVAKAKKLINVRDTFGGG